jgi:hypothetical protein
LPEFTSSLGRVSIIFILPHNILYLQRSNDPVFPAPVHIPYGNFSYWVKLDPFASALGCVNSFEICDPVSAKCMTQKGEGTGLSPFSPPFSMFMLAYASLSASTIYQTIGLRGARALRADTLIDRNLKQSRPLDPEQWKLEVRQIFETSLLRSQLEALNIANGVGAHESGYHDLYDGTPVKSSICGTDMVKVKAPSHKSVSVRGVVLILAACLIIFILSINPGGKLVVGHFSVRRLRDLNRIVGVIHIKMVRYFKVCYHLCMDEMSRRRRRRGRIALD